MGKRGGGGGGNGGDGGGGRGRLYTYHYTVTTRMAPATTFEDKGELKWILTEVPLLTSLIPLITTRPN